MKSHHHFKGRLCLEIEMFHATDCTSGSEIEKCEPWLQSAVNIMVTSNLWFGPEIYAQGHLGQPWFLMHQYSAMVLSGEK